MSAPDAPPPDPSHPVRSSPLSIGTMERGGDSRGEARAAGILLHPTSLPGPHGIGDLGAGAYGFVDYLVAAGQTLWQVLPLGPTGFGDSPYAARSAFAGNPLLISLERVRDQGLLAADDLGDAPPFDPDRVDFEG